MSGKGKKGKHVSENARPKLGLSPIKLAIFVALFITLLVLAVSVILASARDAGFIPTDKEPTAQETVNSEEPAKTVSEEQTAEDEKQETDAPGTEAAETADTSLTPLEQAERLAAGYDYDAAIGLICAIEGYEEDDELTAAAARFEEAKAACVRYEDPTTITHIFYHSLIVDTSRAFDGEYTEDGYNLYMATVSEFRLQLEEMYERGYVLVDIHDVAYQQTQDDGSVVFVPGDIYLPEGKIPFVLSQDDVNYYKYMVDSDDDCLPDAGGDGFASRIVIDDNGELACEYITADGETLVGDYDLVPIVESFIAEHPDFSYRGARGTLGVTGYNGVFGYRTDSDGVAILGEAGYAQAVKAARAVAECLKEHGWTIASHSFGHPDYSELGLDSVAKDIRRWADEVQPIVGETDVFIYPYGGDIAGIETYSGGKYEALYAAGFRYFCNVDSHEYWVQITDSYVRQGRRNVDGYRMYWQPELLDDLFEVAEVYDSSRPPVPSL